MEEYFKFTLIMRDAWALFSLLWWKSHEIAEERSVLPRSQAYEKDQHCTLMPTKLTHNGSLSFCVEFRILFMSPSRSRGFSHACLQGTRRLFEQSLLRAEGGRLEGPPADPG